MSAGRRHAAAERAERWAARRRASRDAFFLSHGKLGRRPPQAQKGGRLQHARQRRRGVWNHFLVLMHHHSQ